MLYFRLPHWARGVAFAALAVTVAALLTPAPAAQTEGTAWVVTVRPGVDPTPLAEGVAARLRVRPTHVYRHALRGLAVRLTPAQVALLRQDPRVERVLPDGVAVLPRAPVQVLPGALGRTPGTAPRTRQKIPTGVLRCGATASPTAAIDGQDQVLPIDVAVLDTGISLRHPDLRVVGGFTTEPDGLDDPHGHGTHVAGIIAARDNLFGVVGVAPGARLWSVRVLDRKGTGTWSDIAAGLDWIAARADTLRVVNISVGGPNLGAEVLQEAVSGCLRAGITLVAAAGNQASDTSGTVPASYDGVIAVSALADSNGAAGASAGMFRVLRAREQDESFAFFSNWGPAVDLIAPGCNIRSTYRGRGYATISGTSQAAPHVTGAAALYLLRNPGASPAQVEAALKAAGSPFAPDDDPDGIHEPALDVRGL